MAGLVMRKAHFPGRAPIDAYGDGGFRFADMSHRGSLLCLPSGIHGWEPGDAGNLTLDDFQLVLPQAAALGLLLIGTGPDLKPLRPELKRALREAGISVEIMSTGAAVRTYNVLLAEDRVVSAALVAVD
jgi:uncharacterized protein